jgi:hypothetical protein
MNLLSSFRTQVLALCSVLSLAAAPSIGESPQLLGHPTLRSETVHAFDSYVAAAERKNASSLTGGNYLWVDDLPEVARREAHEKLKHGDVILQRVSGPDASTEIPDGMVHDWEGLVFIPGVKLQDVLTVLQDYDHQSTYFAPDVERSRIEEHNGEHYRVFLRFRRTNVITVVLDTEHDINYFRDSSTQAHSRSSAIRISEVDNPGSKSEKEIPPGKDDGFLWRMETWWRMQEKDGGVYVQNQTVSLTRGIPAGLSWAVEPFVTAIPKESLEFTLGAIRRTVLSKSKSTQSCDPHDSTSKQARNYFCLLVASSSALLSCSTCAFPISSNRAASNCSRPIGRSINPRIERRRSGSPWAVQTVPT